MKKGYILSAIVGGACFAVPFCLEIATMPVSLLFGVLGYGAGTLMFSDSKTNMTLGKNNENLVDVLNNAKKMNSAILNMINKVSIFRFYWKKNRNNDQNFLNVLRLDFHSILIFSLI